ncbi:uncharacterized protein PHACADRAFT_161987 [Phanerochaete carnosa HHB-10118-sp]|uniref:Uncharacterized protein n=1 Tax=Phanerochaete carnosa (strain HHB-10118-sp) TaxID=650164 RepID=K5V0F7_PHACS|nr:uncharacterized protein PHACADRAFT_161987 [Phanerochaete carnosa HHB-10118-sp]EKM55946.1 hypothetical protein PHACADRAFT_161987 [Phanerochaete carnosa HHB-10118-sp]
MSPPPPIAGVPLAGVLLRCPAGRLHPATSGALLSGFALPRPLPPMIRPVVRLRLPGGPPGTLEGAQWLYLMSGKWRVARD